MTKQIVWTSFSPVTNNLNQVLENQYNEIIKNDFIDVDVLDEELDNEEDNKILGFIISEISSDLNHSFGVICDILIQKDSRCKGIGTLLINNALYFFKENNIDQIFIESGLNNELAHNFFENI